MASVNPFELCFTQHLPSSIFNPLRDFNTFEQADSKTAHYTEIMEMEIDFENIHQHIIPMNDFPMKWRFTEENYDVLPDQHFEQLKPLNKKAANFLWDFIAATNLHADIPFKKDFFRTIDKAQILDGNEKEIKKWLYHRGLPFDKPVFLSWQPNEAMIVPWKIVIKYFDSFYYGIADDLTIVDPSLNWALLFYHEHEIYFGTNKNYEPDKTFADYDFLW